MPRSEPLWASTLDTSSVPVGSIQRILGHERRTTTEIYLHSLGKAEREDMLVYEEVSHRFTHTDEGDKNPMAVTCRKEMVSRQGLEPRTY